MIVPEAVQLFHTSTGLRYVAFTVTGPASNKKEVDDLTRFVTGLNEMIEKSLPKDEKNLPEALKTRFERFEK